MASDSAVPLASTEPGPHVPVTVIEPQRGWLRVNLRELLRYRELLGLLVWRDIAVRYKQSIGGLAWAVVQPILATGIFTVIFSLVLQVPSNGTPYPVFAFCALLPWNYFARSLTGSGQSLVRSTNLITKVYFPRLILPLTDLVVALVDFLIALVILLTVSAAAYGMFPTWRIAMLPAFLLLAMATALGVGLWLTALGARYRDVNQITPFLVQAWMWASPVIYPSSSIPASWRTLYGLNPMVGVIEGFRWIMLDHPAPHPGMMAASIGVVLVLLVSGLAYFTRIERTLADVI